MSVEKTIEKVARKKAIVETYKSDGRADHSRFECLSFMMDCLDIKLDIIIEMLKKKEE